MSVESSTTTFKADITNFKAAMSEAARLVRTANSEFKAATAGMDKWSSSTDGLTAKTKQLQTVLTAQERQLDVLKAAYEKVAKEEGEDSKGAQELTIKINNQTAAIKTTQSELDKYQKELDEAGKENEELAEDVKKSSDAMEKANEGFTVAKGVLANLVAEGIRMATQALKDFATEAFNVGASFEAAMSKVQAVSGANAEEIVQLTDKAKEMGEKTVFSATQSAEAFNYMAMAGWKTEDMLNGIEGVMNLAAASGADLATTSDIVTDALTAFGLEAKDSGHFADVLAAASSNANTNVEMMGETFKYAAPIAGALGYSIEDTAVAIGLMANAGIKSSQAGTALRKIFTELNGEAKLSSKNFGTLTISTSDATGKMRPFADVLKDLRDAFSKMTDSEKAANAEALVGKTAMSGLLAMVNATEKDFNKLTNAIDGSAGAAENMAKTMTDNVQGQLTLLRSNIEGKMIKVFEAAAPAIRSAITEIGNAINSLDMDAIAAGVSAFAKALGEMIAYVLKNGGAIIDTLKTIGAVMATVFVVNKLGAFIGMINSAVAAYGSLNGVLALVAKSQLFLNAAQLASPLGAIVVGVGALIAGYMSLQHAQSEAAKEAYGLTDAQKELNNAIADNYNAQQEQIKARDDNVAAITGEYNRIKDLKEEYNNLIGVNGEVKSGYEDRASFILNELAEALGMEKSEVQELIGINGQLSDSIDQIIQKKQAEATLGAYEDSYKKAKASEKEAIENVVNAQNQATESERKYGEVLAEYTPIAEEYNRYLAAGVAPLGELGDRYSYLSKAVEEARVANEANKVALEQANQAYVDGQTTIKNYEGLSTAIITNNTAGINEALTNLTSGFRDATSATKTELEQQVADCEKYYNDIKSAMDAGNPVITEAMVSGAKEMVDKAKAELEKFSPAASTEGMTAAQKFVLGVSNASSEASTAGQEVIAKVEEGLKSIDTEKTGTEKGENFSKGIDSTKDLAYASGQAISNEGDLGAKTIDGYDAGENFGEGFVQGIEAKVDAAREAGKKLADAANEGAKDAAKIESPSKVMIENGHYFGEGFVIGIDDKIPDARNSAAKLGAQSEEGLNRALDIHSPSKLTETTGRNFVKGFINGIVNQEGSLVTAIKGLVNIAVTELGKASNFNYSEVGQNAITAISNATKGNLTYITSRLAYENDKKVKEFDAQIKKLEKQRDTELKKAEGDKDKQDSIKKKYEKLINTQKSYKSAYQTASRTMLNDLQMALSEYERAAVDMVDSTISGITQKYDERYNELINKQKGLASTLKSAGTLFNISNAGIMTVNDLNKQTQDITNYTNKLQKIKGKVSAELFDEITSFDMKEGSAFLDRLLGMSDADLAKYNQAYTEKVQTIANNTSNLYKADMDKVAADYKNELAAAFKDLPAQLEKLGMDAMKGFINGFKKDTDYMDKAVKTFATSIIKQFKKELKIKSPSKVTYALGEYTGEGFANGMLSIQGYVRRVASQIADAARIPIEDYSGYGNLALSGAGGGTVITNNYNLVQNNTSPKSLSALETYQARRQQIALIKAFAP